MNAIRYDVDWREVLTGEVRSIQGAYPIAHAALGDWGMWCRYRFGLYPRIARPAIWQMGKPIPPGEFADEGETGAGSPEDRQNRLKEVEVKPESPPNRRFNERLAVEMDIHIHRDNFPTIWRRCLRAAYVYQVPEYQFPTAAKCGSSGFVMFFEASLNRLERLFL